MEENNFELEKNVEISSEDETVAEEKIKENIEEKIRENTEKSEFERELENYLPTPDKTDKIKKRVQIPILPIAASALTCIVILVFYSAIILPHLRPSAVISYVERPAQKATESGETLSIRDINTAVSPSIVSIRTKASYRNFFGVSSSTNTGSGVILSADGYVLTSSSLVGNDGETTVILSDNKEYPAKTVGADEKKDIAILKIDASDLPAVTLGNSDEVSAGDTAIVIGNVLGGDLGTSVTKGIICGVNSNVALQSGGTVNLLQTDAITNSNNAGGCLLNGEGQLVGMITYAISADAGNISFAIPSNDIKNVAQSLINTGNPPEALMIGITGSNSDHGILVESVAEDTPAAKAGIKTNDMILKADGKAVTSIAELNEIKATHQKGEKISLTIYRDGEIINVDVIL